MKRILTTLLTFSLIVGSIAGLLTIPVAARVYSVQPTNEDGGPPTDQFTTADPIFAIFRSDVEGGKICVVPEGKPDDKSFCKTLANYVGTGWWLIARRLPVGRYQLLAYDPSYSFLSVPFEVTECTAPDCAVRRRIGNEVVEEWKHAAEEQLERLHAVATSIKIGEIGDAFFEARFHGLDLVEDPINHHIKGWMATAALTGAVGGLAFAAIELSQLGVPTSFQGAFLILAHEVTEGTRVMYEDIVNDPPDSNYTTVAAPAFTEWPSTGDPLHDRVVRTFERQRAFGRAQLRAYERYLGAAADGQEVYVHIQSQAVADYGEALAAEMKESAAALRAWAAQLDPNLITITQEHLDETMAVYERVRASGFTQDELNQLAAAGFGAEEISQVRAAFDEDISQTPVGVPMHTIVNQAADALEANVPAINTFSQTAAWVADGRAPKTISLSPASASLMVGATHTVSATVTDARSGPVAGVLVKLSVTGVNPAQLTATTNAGGVATFSYVGNNAGVDTLSARAGTALSNNATVNWSVGPLNALPSVRVYNETVEEGTNGQIQFDFTDADIQDTHTATIDWGDGSPLDTYPSPNDSAGIVRESNGSGFVIGFHRYVNSGIYSAKATVADNRGGVGVGVSTVKVNNFAPVLGGITLEEVNHEIVVKANFTDRSLNNTHTAIVDWGDGTSSAGTVTESGGSGMLTASHAYGGQGHYTITLTVFDDAGGNAARSFTFTVSEGGLGNSPPSVQPSNYAVYEGSGPFSGAFTDPDTLDVHTATINWGDGSPTEALDLNENNHTLYGRHNYVDNGTFNLTITLADNHGGVDVEVATMTVYNAAPRVSPIGFPTNARLYTVGDVISVSTSFMDFGVRDTHTAVWDWGDGTTTPASFTEVDGSASVSDSHAYNTPGVYMIKLIVTDNDGESGVGTAFEEIGVYSSITSGSIKPVVTETGKISASISGLGITARDGFLQVDKPAGATVRRAYLGAATTGFYRYLLRLGDIKLENVDAVWDIVSPSGIHSFNYWADVTGIIKTRLDSAPGGRIDLSLHEAQTDSTDGEILIVIFDDPNQIKDNTVALLFGAQQTVGDTFALRFAQPLDLSDPHSTLTMSLGISFGHQDQLGQQYSLIDVNGRRMTTSAGGEDDGEMSNGALITVGGLGDSPDNPGNPEAAPTQPRSDDELYNLRPFVSAGDMQLTVQTSNPSNDDNIFFAAFFLQNAAAVVGEGIVLTPLSSSREVGTQHTLTATAQDAEGKLLPGRDVTFEVLSGPHAALTATVATDAKGLAQFTYTGTKGGTDAIVAKFINSQGKAESSNTVTTEWKGPTVAPTLLTVSPASGDYGGTTNLSARLTADGVPLASKDVSFSLNGTPLGIARTDAAGVATISNVSLANINAGLHYNAVAAQFAGDMGYEESHATADLTVRKAMPYITWSNPSDITYGTPLGNTQLNAVGSVPGTLTYTPAAGTVLPANGTRTLHVVFTPGDPTNYSSASKDVSINVRKATVVVTADNKSRIYNTINPPLTFRTSGFVNGDTAATAFTGAPTLMTTAQLASNAGTYLITAAIGTLSSANYSFTFAAGTLTINKATTTTIADSKMFALQGAAILTASLRDINSLPIVNRTLTLTLGTGPGAQTCTATTDGLGNGSCRITTVTQSVGPGTISASFAGDKNYLASAGNAPSLIFAFPAGMAGGNFVIGSRNAVVGKQVTFWDAQWAKLNPLAGVAAPASFKGFANETSTKPLTCGGSWTTGPGNSSGPPKSIPTYMAIIVSSSITQSGSTIGGNVSQIAIVKTNPGYDSNPGHAGTGTVVAVWCP
jgi:hypothetical protein